MNEDTVRRIEAALEERKRQRRKAAATPEPPPIDRRGAARGRRDKDETPGAPADPR